MYTKIIFIFCIFFFMFMKANAQVIVVISHPEVEIETLDKDELFQILIQEGKYRVSNSELIIVDNHSGKIRNSFFSRFGKNNNFFEKIWNENKFKGVAKYPIALDNESNIIKYVMDNEYAISFVSMTALMNEKHNVKILLQF